MHNKTVEMIILVYLLSVFSVPSSLGLYKRSTSSSNTIEPAAWSVSLNQTGVSGNMQLTAGDTTGSSYTLRVVSNSEVDTVYDIIVSNIPSGVQVKLDNGTYQQPQSNTVTFTSAGTILYGAQSNENTHTLTFKADSGATLVNNQTVTINVDFKQD